MSDPMPPPPPPSMAPPPGYAEYQPTNWVGTLRRVSGLAKAIVILLAVIAVGQVISLATSKQALDAARDFLRDGDEDAFTEGVSANTIGGLVGGVAQIAVIVLTFVWLYRVASNHRQLGRRLTWAPGWAIGGWFLPPLLFIIPLLMLRETWKASDPDGGDRDGENPAIWLWFVLYSLAPIALMILGATQAWGGVGRDTADLAEYIDDQYGVIIAQGIVTILAAGAFAMVVRGITQRHTRLTGEATAR